MRRYAILTAALAALCGCGSTGSSGSSKIDTGQLENDIRGPLASQVSERTGTDVSVESINCVAQSDQAGSCLANLRDETGSTKVHIRVEIDPDTGKALWSVDQ